MSEKGHKDKGLRLDLFPPQAAAEVALVYTIGARKYAPHNWRCGGIPASDFIAALKRHLLLFEVGESYDAAGFHHLAAVIFHAAALMELELDRPADDNRVFASEKAFARIKELMNLTRIEDNLLTPGSASRGSYPTAATPMFEQPHTGTKPVSPGTYVG